MSKTRSARLPRVDFLADLRRMLFRRRWKMAVADDRIVVLDKEGRKVASFRSIDANGPSDLSFGD
jgi:hypothetical protein